MKIATYKPDKLQDRVAKDWQDDRKYCHMVMGEFGAWRQNPAVWPTGKAAAAGMVQQQIDSCKFNFAGTMYWTYDTMEQPRLWNMKSAPEIGEALSPKLRPDPCKGTGQAQFQI